MAHFLTLLTCLRSLASAPAFRASERLAGTLVALGNFFSLKTIGIGTGELVMLMTGLKSLSESAESGVLIRQRRVLMVSAVEVAGGNHWKGWCSSKALTVGLQNFRIKTAPGHWTCSFMVRSSANSHRKINRAIRTSGSEAFGSIVHARSSRLNERPSWWLFGVKAWARSSWSASSGRLVAETIKLL